MACVAGYTIVNDITLRETAQPDARSFEPNRFESNRLGPDWLQSKNSPGFLPSGPFLVPAAFVPDPHALHLQLTLNGETMQSAQTSGMLFDIATQIEYISQHAQLLPGDIICTGSPTNSSAHDERYLQPGDVMEATIEGLGTQRTRCVAEYE